MTDLNDPDDATRSMDGVCAAKTDGAMTGDFEWTGLSSEYVEAIVKVMSILSHVHRHRSFEMACDLICTTVRSEGYALQSARAERVVCQNLTGSTAQQISHWVKKPLAATWDALGIQEPSSEANFAKFSLEVPTNPNFVSGQTVVVCFPLSVKEELVGNLVLVPNGNSVFTGQETTFLRVVTMSLASALGSMDMSFADREQDRESETGGVEPNSDDQFDQQRRERQKHAMSSIRTFAGGVAHELNNMVTVIATCAELLKERLTAAEIDPTPVRTIQNASNHAFALSKQLVLIGRNSIPEQSRFEMSGAIDSLIPSIRDWVGDAIELQWDLERNLPPVHLSPEQLDQLLRILIENALDAMPDGGLIRIQTAQRSIGVKDASDPECSPCDYAELSVNDSGCGMSDEVRERLLEPFFSTKFSRQTTGLSMAIAHSMVQACGGHISVESELGKGTRVAIRLPSAEQAVGERDDNLLTNNGHYAGRILIVESDESVRRSACTVLRHYGFEVIQTTCVDQAAQVLKRLSGEIDLVLTAFVIEPRAGDTMAEQHGGTSASIPTLRMIDHDSGSETGLSEDGFILRKPFHVSTLIRTVRSSLASR